MNPEASYLVTSLFEVVLCLDLGFGHPSVSGLGGHDKWLDPRSFDELLEEVFGRPRKYFILGHLFEDLQAGPDPLKEVVAEFSTVEEFSHACSHEFPYLLRKAGGAARSLTPQLCERG